MIFQRISLLIVFLTFQTIFLLVSAINIQLVDSFIFLSFSFLFDQPPGISASHYKYLQRPYMINALIAFLSGNSMLLVYTI